MRLPSSIKRIILRVVSLAVLPVSVLWWLGQLTYHLPRFWRSDVVIIDPHMINYGNDLVSQDATRRLFPGRKVIYAMIYEPGSTHNTKIGLIWPGPDFEIMLLRKAVVSFSAFGRFFSFPEIGIFTPVLRWITDAFFSILAPGVNRMTRKYVRSALPVPPSLANIITENYGDASWGAVLRSLPCRNRKGRQFTCVLRLSATIPSRACA